jgi:hypothetical protein
LLDRLLAAIEAGDHLEGQYMHAANVVVGVIRDEAVEMGTAD